jgi:hypothetical protein
MIWNDHHELEGKHAFLGASNFHWINWTDEEFENHYYNQYSTVIGTAIHELAHDCIMSRTHLTKHDKNTINITLYHAYVPLDSFDPYIILNNLIPFIDDAIGYHMSSEILLYYNEFCFGTTDAICFNESEKKLRIHDLKTGEGIAHIEQLLLYSALFCLEYSKDPSKISTELRIYQNSQVSVFVPTSEQITRLMDLIRLRTSNIVSIHEREGK